MCGVVGVLELAGAEVSRDLVKAMSDAIVHRGPDDKGMYVSAARNAALGSRRLSIIDLSVAGHMPMCNEDRTVWVAFNGEIYNFRELRRQLELRGHHLVSHTDTEVLVHLYEEKGDNFLEDLDGMFAIALWDDRQGRLLLARDRLGEKPLYYTEHMGSFRFASEIKAILADPDVPRTLELGSLNQYLTFGFVQPPFTMFAGIRKLGPGEVLTIDSTKVPWVRRYWTPVASEAQRKDWSEHPMPWHVSEVRRHLERAVAGCLIADVPVGAFLSGGIDSSAVVTLMARLTGRPIECVTVIYPGQPVVDESPFAASVAAGIGASLHRVAITEQEAFDSIGDCVYHLDEPISDPAAVNSFFGSRYLRGMGVPVALVGEGADEIFLGYPYYLRHRRLAPVWTGRRFMPRAMRRALYASVAPLLGPLGIGVHRDLIRRAAEGEGLFISSEPFFSDVDKRRVTGGGLRDIGAAYPSANVTEQVLRDVGGAIDGDLLAQMGLAEVRMRMAEKLLMRVDKLSMANSVEVRAPLVDHHLARYVLSLPSAIRVAGGRPKGLLRLAVADLLSPETLNRKKVGFSTPVAHWLRSSFGDLLERLIARSPLFAEGLLDKVEALRLLREHRTGRVQHHTKLWNLFCLLQWAERYGVVSTSSSRLAA